MTEEEFSRRLQAYMFGKLSSDSTVDERANRQILAEAVLESADRGIQYGQAVELRDHLSDRKHRQELIHVLEPSPVLLQESWWLSLFRLRNLSVMAASAALIVGVAFLLDRVLEDSKPGQAPALVPSETAHTKPPPAFPVSPSASPTPNFSNDAMLSTETPKTAEIIAELFALPESRITDLDLRLARVGGYKAEDSVTAIFKLSDENRVYALVLGPSGSVRRVFPLLSADAGMLSAGEHTFLFPAGGQMDPGTGGKSRLRVFITTEDHAGLVNSELWKKLIAASRFQEVDYEVQAP